MNILTKATQASAPTTGNDLTNKTYVDAQVATKAASSHTHTTAQITNLDSTLAAKANLASPALTGTPTAPTAATTTSSTQIATTAYVKNQGYATVTQLNTKANIASPTFTGTPLAPTPASTDNSTKIATTAFVRNFLATSGSVTKELITASGSKTLSTPGLYLFVLVGGGAGGARQNVVTSNVIRRGEDGACVGVFRFLEQTETFSLVIGGGGAGAGGLNAGSGAGGQTELVIEPRSYTTRGGVALSAGATQSFNPTAYAYPVPGNYGRGGTDMGKAGTQGCIIIYKF